MTEKNEYRDVVGALDKGVTTQYEQALTGLGLHEHEAKAYIALIQSRLPLGGSQISAHAGIHRQYVYSALPKLIEKGLITEIKHGEIHKYKAESASRIELLGRKQAVLAGEVSDLLSEIQVMGDEQDFEVIKGTSHIQKYELLRARSVQEGHECIIGGATHKFSELMGALLDRYLIERNKSKHSVRYLGTENERASYKEFIGKYKNQEYRFLKKLPSGIAHMVINEKSVSFYTFVQPPLLYIVHSEEVAKHYKKFFEMLWEMGE